MHWRYTDGDIDREIQPEEYQDIFSRAELVDAARLLLESLGSAPMPDSGIYFVELSNAREKAVATLVFIMQSIDDDTVQFPKVAMEDGTDRAIEIITCSSDPTQFSRPLPLAVPP